MDKAQTLPTDRQNSHGVVIIPHYDDLTRLDRCLTALMENDLTGVEIVVVDNDTPRSLDALKRKFPAVRFLTEPEKGAAAARNRGVAETTAPHLFFIDADCVADQNWLTVARQCVRPDTLIGGRVDVFDEGHGPRSGAQAFETVFAFDFRSYIEDKGFTGAGNLVTTRQVFDDVGPFLNGVSEDLEWSQRAVEKGYDLIYVDDLVVSHPTRSDWQALKRKWRRMTDEAFQLAQVRPLGRLKWALRALAMPLSIFAHAPRILRHPGLRSGRERILALLTLVRQRLLRMVWMLKQSLTHQKQSS